MVTTVTYNINTTEGPRHITIKPVNEPVHGGDYYKTGIYRLSDGVVGMGNIIFDSEMNEWQYDGIDELTYEEAKEIAEFIKNYKDPEGSDPGLLQL